MPRKHTIVAFIIILLPFYIITKNLPIVLVHGIFSDKHTMIPAKKLIKKYLPNTYVKIVTLGEGKLTSFFNMHDQVTWLKNELESDKNLTDGCIIIAHSQGGLVARYFIEKYNNPRVYVYISWGAPECGIFGSPGTADQRFAWLQTIQRYSYKLLYSYLMQRAVSFAGYWKDPLHYQEYLQKCRFLPYLNNEIQHADCTLFKENICSLTNMVLVQSTEEDVIDPVASSHFYFYPEGSTNTLVNLCDSTWYQEDHLGLKTLNDTGRLHLKFAHCTHVQYQEDVYNFVENTLPYLIYEAPLHS
jgi:palmitoyl-protein thioesterase